MKHVEGGTFVAKLEEGTLYKVALSSPSIPKINFLGLLCRSFLVHETALEWSVCIVFLWRSTIPKIPLFPSDKDGEGSSTDKEPAPA